jgi:hypothetical protein
VGAKKFNSITCRSTVSDEPAKWPKLPTPPDHCVDPPPAVLVGCHAGTATASAPLAVSRSASWSILSAERAATAR